MKTYYTPTSTREHLLLAGLRAGEPKAVQEWYQSYEKRLLRYILSRVSNLNDAEELVHDTFLSCLQSLPLFRGESGVWTWMVHVAQHEVADYFRKRYAKKFLHCLPLGERIIFDDLRDAHEVASEVHHILKKMAHEHREILLMKYVDRKSVQQIARELSRTVKSVESILFRARIEFRSLYASGEGSS
jgi:RNA polymerase sigma-70 factor (ECF subfamily)